MNNKLIYKKIEGVIKWSSNWILVNKRKMANFNAWGIHNFVV